MTTEHEWLIINDILESIKLAEAFELTLPNPIDTSKLPVYNTVCDYVSNEYGDDGDNNDGGYGQVTQRDIDEAGRYKL